MPEVSSASYLNTIRRQISGHHGLHGSLNTPEAGLIRTPEYHSLGVPIKREESPCISS
jgi:hypothetical protein